MIEVNGIALAWQAALLWLLAVLVVLGCTMFTGTAWWTLGLCGVLGFAAGRRTWLAYDARRQERDLLARCIQRLPPGTDHEQ